MYHPFQVKQVEPFSYDDSDDESLETNKEEALYTREQYDILLQSTKSRLNECVSDLCHFEHIYRSRVIEFEKKGKNYDPKRKDSTINRLEELKSLIRAKESEYNHLKAYFLSEYKKRIADYGPIHYYP